MYSCKKDSQETHSGPDPVKVDLTLDEAEAADFDALLLPGGQMNPDKLRMEPKAVQIAKEFVAAGKPVAAICHGPWLLVEADVVEGKTVTSWPSIRTDLKNAGANVVDQEVAQDGNLITSRKPDDIPAFSEALMQEVRYDGIKVSYVMPGSVDTEFGGRGAAKRGWALQGEDVARVVIDLLHHPSRSLPSRVEIRPSQPPRKN